MPQAIIPWEPQNIPIELQEELNRRKVNRSFTYIDGAKGGWGDKGDWEKYRGPMSPWIRFCSNGAGKSNKALSTQYQTEYFDRQGFVLFGGKDFYSGYGFRNAFTVGGRGNDSIVGYMPDGTPHTIDNNLKTSEYPIHVPSPEIEKISVTIQKELFRRASVEWVCFSKAQLEYMTPYFLVPGISCVLEWGWNHFKPECLLDLTNTTQLREYRKDPYPLYTEHIMPSKGNYDVLIGIITHFEWSVEGTKFKCKTEITSPDRIYAGLAINSTVVVNSGGSEEPERPFGNLTKFVDEVLPCFKSVGSTQSPETVPQLSEIVKYLKERHPKTWEDYAYGVFYGRDPKDTKPASDYDDKTNDFDRKRDKTSLWINLGLAMECINLHVKPMKSFGEAEMFRVDVDDVVITAHPNLISTDGTTLLIPNAEAPKYFNGRFFLREVNEKVKSVKEYDKARSDYKVLDNCSIPPKPLTEKDARSSKPSQLADWHLMATCKQVGGAYRDDLDEIINKIRYDYTETFKKRYAFPFFSDKDVSKGSKPYPRRYSGYLKNLYVNVDFLKRLVSDNSVKTYTQLIEKLLTGISDAAAGFWDLRLVSGTGADTTKGLPATMKISDYKFCATINRGTPFTFDYFDADSLLLGIGFKPTLSNAQAIRTIYAQTNQPDKKITVTNGTNELLDYMFKDRLMLDEDTGKDVEPPAKKDDQFGDLMRNLQNLTPCSDSLQMTMKDSNGKVLVRRLALPSVDVLNVLLDDGDEEQNPRYTGIMPGIQASFTIQGIGGLRTFMMFLVRNLPEPYSHENIVFRIVDVQETLESGKWTTIITAGVIPLREHIKARLGFTTIQK